MDVQCVSVCAWLFVHVGEHFYGLMQSSKANLFFSLIARVICSHWLEHQHSCWTQLFRQPFILVFQTSSDFDTVFAPLWVCFDCLLLWGELEWELMKSEKHRWFVNEGVCIYVCLCLDMLRVSEGQGTRLPKTRAAQRSTLTSVLQFLGKFLLHSWAKKFNCTLNTLSVHESLLMQLQCGVSFRVSASSPYPSFLPHPWPPDASPTAPPLFSATWPPWHAGKTQLPSPQQDWAWQTLR